MKHNFYKTLIAAVIFCISGLTLHAQTGTSISSYEELNTILRNDLTGSYYLTNDITIPENTEWWPVGMPEDFSGTAGEAIATFTGIFDGQGYSINGLKITGDKSFSGFFGRLAENAIVKNLGLKNVTIEGATPTGALAGTMFRSGSTSYADPGVTIENVFVTGSVKGTSEVGGIVGRVNGNPINVLINCYANASVEATAEVNAFAGGLVGCMKTGRSLVVKKSYFAGTVKATDYAGGILGTIDNPNAATTLKLDSVAVVATEITATNKELFYTKGKLAGAATLINCYARNDIGLTTSEEGTTPEAPETFKTKDFYQTTLGWDFETIWTIEEGVGYPTFKTSGSSGFSNNMLEKTWKISNESNALKVSTVEPLACSVYDVMGKMHFSTVVNDEITFPLNNGIYIVKINHNGKETSQKVIIK